MTSGHSNKSQAESSLIKGGIQNTKLDPCDLFCGLHESHCASMDKGLWAVLESYQIPCKLMCLLQNLYGRSQLAVGGGVTSDLLS